MAAQACRINVKEAAVNSLAQAEDYIMKSVCPLKIRVEIYCSTDCVPTIKYEITEATAEVEK